MSMIQGLGQDDNWAKLLALAAKETHSDQEIQEIVKLHAIFKANLPDTEEVANLMANLKKDERLWKALQPEESVHSRVPTVLQPNSGKKPEAELKLEKSAFEFSPKDAFDNRGGTGILRLSVLVAAEKNKKPHIIVLKSNENGIEKYRIYDSNDIKLKPSFLKDTIEACNDIYPEALSLKEVQEKIEKAKQNGAVLIKPLQDVEDKTIENMLYIINAMMQSPAYGIRESLYEKMDANYRKLNADDRLPQEFKDALKHLVEFAKIMPRPSV